MFQEDRNEVKSMIDSALAGLKVPKEFDDSELKEEIASLKKEVATLKVKPISKKIGG